MSITIKPKRIIRSLAILRFPLSGVLLFDESESSFIRFSIAVSFESASSIFVVKAFCWSIKCCDIACCCCRSNIISVCEWDAPTHPMSKIWAWEESTKCIQSTTALFLGRLTSQLLEGEHKLTGGKTVVVLFSLGSGKENILSSYLR